MNALTKPPARLDRPKLAQFLFDRDLSFQAAGDALGRTKEWVRLVCLPFSDRRRRVPDKADMELIVKWTEGEVRPSDFYPAELNKPDADLKLADNEP